MRLEQDKGTVWPLLAWWLGVVLFVSTTVMASWYHDQNRSAVSAEWLATAKVEGQTMTKTLIAEGIVRPERSANFYLDPSKNSRPKVLVRQGDTVEEGETLLRYDGSGLERQIRALQTEQKKKKLQINHRNERIVWLREQMASLEAKPMIRTYENEIEQLAFENRLDRLELDGFSNQMEALKQQRDALEVKSPFSGTVIHVNEHPSSKAKPLLILGSHQRIVTGELPEQQAALVKFGQPATITSAAVKDGDWQGKVAEVARFPAKVREQTKSGQSSYPFKVRFSQPVSRLHQGYHVKVEITLANHENVPVVPKQALIHKKQHTYVYRIDHGRLELRRVVSGMEKGEMTEIRKGLSIGDTIVVDPFRSLRDGMTVTDWQTEMKKEG
ncbi:MAG TPA: efflux RND transporter periplasmic adaptor subunit [Bacillales bacterium]|nr:efflux RND transporter periplasmic adaptor subunit [Bacillales bacterium]